MKKFTDSKLFIASGNKGKIKEIKELLSPFNIEILSISDFNKIVEPEETGLTFKSNSELKAKYYSEKTGLPSLADDSGLCVDQLNGQPGIYSARWAGESKCFEQAMKRVENELVSINAPSPHCAKFICSLSLYWPEDNHMETFEGAISGTLSFPPKGTKGFGYDPIFIPNGYDKTFAQIEPEIKHQMSHRSDAFDQLVKNCF